MVFTDILIFQAFNSLKALSFSAMCRLKSNLLSLGNWMPSFLPRRVLQLLFSRSSTFPKHYRGWCSGLLLLYNPGWQTYSLPFWTLYSFLHLKMLHSYPIPGFWTVSLQWTWTSTEDQQHHWLSTRLAYPMQLRRALLSACNIKGRKTTNDSNNIFNSVIIVFHVHKIREIVMLLFVPRAPSTVPGMSS